MTCNSPRRRSVHFGVNLLIEEALSQDVKLSVLLPDGVRSHKLELLQGKLVKLVLDFPDVGLLQFGYRLPGGGLLLRGLPQVGLLACGRFRESISQTADMNSSPDRRRRRRDVRRQGYLTCRALWLP